MMEHDTCFFFFLFEYNDENKTEYSAGHYIDCVNNWFTSNLWIRRLVRVEIQVKNIFFQDKVRVSVRLLICPPSLSSKRSCLIFISHYTYCFQREVERKLILIIVYFFDNMLWCFDQRWRIHMWTKYDLLLTFFVNLEKTACFLFR